MKFEITGVCIIAPRSSYFTHGFYSCHAYYSVAMLHMHIVTKCYAGSLRATTPTNQTIIETFKLNIAITRVTTILKSDAPVTMFYYVIIT